LSIYKIITLSQLCCQHTVYRSVAVGKCVVKHTVLFSCDIVLLCRDTSEQYTLIRCDFSHYKKCFIPQAARSLHVLSAELGPRFPTHFVLSVHSKRW
jgi:hypothetical protein